jgi:hypothetical protein
MIKQALINALIQSDIYGYPVSLNFDQNNKYRSSIGGSLSLITIATIVVLACNGAISLINRESDYVNNHTHLGFLSTNGTFLSSDSKDWLPKFYVFYPCRLRFFIEAKFNKTAFEYYCSIG